MPILGLCLLEKKQWKAGKGVVRVEVGFNIKQESKFLVLLYPLSNIETTTNFSNKPKFNRIYSIDNLHEVKDGACVINCNDKQIDH